MSEEKVAHGCERSLSLKRYYQITCSATHMATEGYCVKCKAKREIQGEKEVTMNGKGGKTRRALTGTCPKCGTKMFRILGAK